MKSLKPGYILGCVLLLTGSIALAQTRSLPASREVPASRQEVMLSYAPLVKRTAPAVVNIFTKRTEKLDISPLVRDPAFRLFMEDAMKMMGVESERVVRSLGSGVIVRPDGYIVTNNHVIEGSDEIRIVLHDRREFDADIITTDSKTDMALLKVDTGGEPLPHLAIRNSDSLEVGDIVLAIGNPFGIGQTVTSGIISALARTTVGITDYQFFIQTDAAINPGNSGGALVTMDGRLVGINTAIYSRSGGSNGIGFATPSNIVESIVASVETGGRIVRPWLGAAVQPLTREMADSVGLDRTLGVIISRVVPAGPAANAGLKVGDIVLQANGLPVEDAQGLRYRIVTQDIGAEVTLTLLRDGQKIERSLRMQAPTFDPAPDYTTLKGPHPLSGATLANLSPALAYDLDMEMTEQGVVVTEVEPRSSAGQLRLQAGDIIESVDGNEISRVSNVEPLLLRRSAGWLISLRRGSQRLQVDMGRR